MLAPNPKFAFLRSFCSRASLAVGLVGSISAYSIAESYPRVLEATGPRVEDRTIAKVVKKMVERDHISRRIIDDEISSRTFDRFLRQLDSLKLYFLQSDIDELSKYKNQLDDNAQRGDISFAYTAYNRLMERIKEMMPTVHQMIDAEHDFTIDETIPVDRDILEYSKTLAESQERWRKQVKYSLLILKADKKTDEEARAQLHRRYRTHEKNREQMDVYELLEMYLSSLTESFDPHTNYMAPRAQDNFKIQLGLQLQGIGATLQSEDGITVIAGTVPGGAADKDGRLKKGDRIIAVGQEGSSEMVDVVDMKLDDVVSLIRGSAGTKVRLSFQPKVGTETKTIEITRAKIELKDSAARGEVLERGMKADGTPYRVGYIELPSFYFDMDGSRQGTAGARSTKVDIEAILKRFKTQNVDGVVLDLSRNGGGSLSESIGCTGLFIDRGPVVQVKDSEGQSVTYEDEDRGVTWDGPLVVMTSKLSASASEIFAGAIKDYGRGIVVGDPTTHGKGTVQQLEDVGQEIFGSAARPLGALKITIQQFYLPDGKSTQLDGVAADVVLPSITANMEGLSESDLDHALPTDRIPQRPHAQYAMIDQSIRDDLSARSDARVKQSEEFQKLQRRIDAYLKQKSEKHTSLKESDFLARQAEFSADKEEEEQMKKQEDTKDKIFDENYYNEEVLWVTLDYLQALKQRKLAKG
jgi:carboxyl-terminal processing protease